MGDKKKGGCKTTMAKMTAAPKSKPTSAAIADLIARIPDNHTPGEWVTDRECGDESVLGPKGFMVADCAIFHRKRSVAESRANAALIALAPELAAALRAQAEEFARLTEELADEKASTDSALMRWTRAKEEIARLREALDAVLLLPVIAEGGVECVPIAHIRALLTTPGERR